MLLHDFTKSQVGDATLSAAVSDAEVTVSEISMEKPICNVRPLPEGEMQYVDGLSTEDAATGMETGGQKTKKKKKNKSARDSMEVSFK